MNKFKNTANSVKINLYINIINLVPFIILCVTGLIILFYDIPDLPESSVVLGLNRAGWLQIHKISAVISLAGTLMHCILHKKAIFASIKKIKNKKNRTLSFYLFIIYIPAVLTAMISWMFFSNDSEIKSYLLEIHDKLGIIITLLGLIHILSYFGWIIKNSRKYIFTLNQ